MKRRCYTVLVLGLLAGLLLFSACPEQASTPTPSPTPAALFRIHRTTIAITATIRFHSLCRGLGVQTQRPSRATFMSMVYPTEERANENGAGAAPQIK